MRFILNSLFFLFAWNLPFQGMSQGDGTNLQKYWYYKTRFNNDFIKIGLAQGESVPFNERGLTQDGYPTSYANSNTGLQTGDAISSIGAHIAALATEYALLKSANQNTDSVKHALFCALNAINRIDHISEQYYVNGYTMALNGFCLRDDVDKNFLLRNYEHFNYYNNGVYTDPNTGLNWPAVNNGENDRGFCSQMLRGQTEMSSGFKSMQLGDESADENTMSQDHYITLLMGLSLVNKLVDYGATDNNKPFPYESQTVTSIKQEAWNIVDRFANHFKNNPSWNYVNPVTNNIVSPGGNTAFTQFGIAEASCKAEGFTIYPNEPFVPLLNNFGSIQPYTCNYTSLHVRTFGFPNWFVYVTTPPLSGDNAAFKVSLLATGHCGWVPAPIDVSDYACNWVSKEICGYLPFPLNKLCKWVNDLICGWVTISVPGFKNETENLIAIHAEQPYGPGDQAKENVPRLYGLWHAPLLHKVLFPNKNTSYGAFLNSVKGALDNAPCEGPYNFGQFARPQFEWTSENRLEKSWNRREWNEPDKGWHGTKKGFQAEFNGVDYMVYHNLYRLTGSNVAAGNYIDLSHRYINVPFPNPNAASCIKPSSCLIRAFETITADNTINSNADVVYKAGKVIVLKPGFNTLSGADFHAYIQRADCSSGAAGLRTAVTDSTKGPENNFYGYDEMGDNVVTHYVDYSNVKDSTREDMLSNILPGNPAQISQTQPVILSDNVFAESKNYFNVYPNPASDFATIEFSLNENENAELIVINNIGQTVAVDAISDSKKYRKTFYTADLAKGIYLVKITTSTDRLLIKKLTLQ